MSAFDSLPAIGVIWVLAVALAELEELQRNGLRRLPGERRLVGMCESPAAP
jgi:hypothetical protein